MNSINVLETCKQIIDEANAVIRYTDSMNAVDDDTLRAVYEEARDDELSHLQKLIVALTEIIIGKDGFVDNGEPTKAAQMDDESKNTIGAEGGEKDE